MAESLNKSDFKANINAAEISIVDFWAEWCTPCKALAAVLDDIEKRYKGKIKFFKVDVDKNREIAASYGIESIPTLIIFRKGLPINSITGFKSKADLEKDIKTALR